MKRIFFLSLILALALTADAKKKQSVPPYKDPSLSVETRVVDLMSRMTLHEKIAQLNQYTLGRNDNVNNIVMWSSKYNKTVSDTNGYFLALNQAQAASHLEKIKQYFKNNVSNNISQSVHLRFFPKDVRTFNVKSPSQHEDDPINDNKQFMPNALDKLSQPKILKDLQEENSSPNSTDTEDFIFEF